MTTSRLLAMLGAMAVAPHATPAQHPQPIVKSIATIANADVDNVVRMPNGHVIVFTESDSITAYDLVSGRTTLIARGWYDELILSRQGNRVAYLRESEDGKTSDLWSIGVDPQSGAPTAKAQRVTAASEYPAFSPDGREIAFSRSHGKATDVVVIPSVGGVSRTVATFPAGVAGLTWSVDGTWIYADAIRDSAARTIMRIPARGGAIRTLMTHSFGGMGGMIGGEIAVYRPDRKAFSAGKMAYGTPSRVTGTFDIPAGSNPGGILTGPDMTLIKITAPATLHYIDIATGRSHAVVTTAATIRYPAWSPDGKRLSFASGRFNHWELCVVNRDGSDLRCVPVSGDGAAGNGASFWSPDSRTIVYYANSGRDLRILTPESGATRLLATLPAAGRLFWPGRWRADGNSFLVHNHSVSATGGNIDYRIVEFRIDGTQRTVRNISRDLPGTWGADILSESTAIVVVGDSSRQRLYSVPLAGGPVRPIPAPEIPAGSRVVWQAMSDKWLARAVFQGRTMIGVEFIPSSGGPGRTVSFPAGTSLRESATFAPNGEDLRMLVRYPDQDSITVVTIAARAGEPRPLGTVPATGAGYGIPSHWTADGTAFAYSTLGPSTSQILDADLRPVLQSIAKPR